MDRKLFELVEKNTPRKRPKDFGITPSELAKSKGCSIHYARKILNELVEAGILKKELMLFSKSTGAVYFEAKKK